MKGYTIITENRWNALKNQCDFFEFQGECIHRGDTCWQMEVMSTDRAGSVIYDYVLVDPKWYGARRETKLTKD